MTTLCQQDLTLLKKTKSRRILGDGINFSRPARTYDNNALGHQNPCTRIYSNCNPKASKRVLLSYRIIKVLKRTSKSISHQKVLCYPSGNYYKSIKSKKINFKNQYRICGNPIHFLIPIAVGGGDNDNALRSASHSQKSPGKSGDRSSLVAWQ